MGIQTLGVVGAGQMGSGIAQVAAVAGLSVIMSDVDQAFVDRGLATIHASLDRFVKKGTMTDAARVSAFQRLSGTCSLSEMERADYVVEAATEKEPLKLEIFRELDRICREEVILASNTSSISITRIGGATNRADRVLGMHFMNPVPMMKLVEIIKGLGTSEATFTATRDLALEMGKVPVPAHDFPGFISNRILMPMINEAIYALFEGVGTPQDIDEVMKLGMNHPMGPLTLADLIGLDTCLAILEVLQKGLGDDKYRPCPLLRKYVDAGWLGRKTKRGFYVY